MIKIHIVLWMTFLVSYTMEEIEELPCMFVIIVVFAFREQDLA